MTKIGVRQWSLAMVLLVLAAGIAWGMTDEEAKLLEQLKSPQVRDRVAVAKVLDREALDVPAVYAHIDQRLQAEAMGPTDVHASVNEWAWLCKALAASGDERYRTTLLRVADSTDNPNLASHCRGAAEHLPYYAARQQAMHQAEGIPGLDPQLNRYVKMMRSGVPRMVADGAKMLARNPAQDARVYDVARDVLLAGYNTGTLDTGHVDAMAWLCNCLGSSQMAKYRQDLEKVAAEASSQKISRYAKAAADKLP